MEGTPDTHTLVQGSLGRGFPTCILDTVRFLGSDMRATEPQFWPMSLIWRLTKTQRETEKMLTAVGRVLRAVWRQWWEAFPESLIQLPLSSTWGE